MLSPIFYCFLISLGLISFANFLLRDREDCFDYLTIFGAFLTVLITIFMIIFGTLVDILVPFACFFLTATYHQRSDVPLFDKSKDTRKAIFFAIGFLLSTLLYVMFLI